MSNAIGSLGAAPSALPQTASVSNEQNASARTEAAEERRQQTTPPVEASRPSQEEQQARRTEAGETRGQRLDVSA